MSYFSSDYVISVHDKILKETGTGCEGCYIEKLEGVINRVEQQFYYNNTADVFEKAAWYGVAIAKGHGFVDGNKRTGLSIMLTVLEKNGIFIPDETGLDDFMVEIADSTNKDTQDHGIVVLAVSDFLKNIAVMAKEKDLNTK